MSLRPFFSFYGAKWRDSPRLYPAPVHDVIVEPFAGSAGYSVRYPDRRVILSDADPVIVGVWQFLIGSSESEIRSLPDLEEGQTVDDLDVPIEAKWLIGFWLNRAAAAPRKSASSWMRSGVRPGSFWGDRVRETIASQLHAIRHWEVRLGSWEGVEVAGEATWFIDPPYVGQGHHYRHGSAGLDYGALGGWARSLPGQVIACEAQGATWLPFQPLTDTKTTRAGKRSLEVVWLAGTNRSEEVA